MGNFGVFGIKYDDLQTGIKETITSMIIAILLAEAIEALPTLTHPNLKHGTWCVRYIEGGNKETLVVPDSCYIFVDRYVVPGETEETCIQQMLAYWQYLWESRP